MERGSSTKRRKLVLRTHVGNVEGSPLTHPAKPWFISTDLDYINGYWTKMSPWKRNVALNEAPHHVVNPTTLGGAFYDSVQHRLHVRRRAADDAEHLGCCRLMLQGLPQFCVARLQLLKQSDVLDSDDGLIGEGFEEGNLLL